MENCKEFQALLRCCHNRGAYAASLSAGVRAIGVVGDETPEEFILAAGFVPVKLAAAPGGETPIADKYLEQVFKPEEKALFELIASGGLPGAVEHIIFSNTSDAAIKLYYYLRDLRRRGNDRIPPLLLLDWRYGDSELNRKWNAAELDGFLARLTQWAGAPLDAAALAHAASLCRRDRDALRRAAELRKQTPPRLTGTEMLVIANASLYMDKADHAALTEQVCAAAEARPGLPGKRLLYFGSRPEGTALFEKLEADGAVVVDDDLCGLWEFPEHDGSVREAVLDRIVRRPPTAKHALPEARAAYLRAKALEARAEAVVCYAGKGDDAIKWDIPSVKAALEPCGIPLIKLDHEGEAVRQ